MKMTPGAYQGGSVFALSKALFAQPNSENAASGKLGQFRADCRPRHPRVGPVLVCRLHDRGIVEAPGFQIEELRMSRRRGVERRPAFRAEMPGQRIAAVAGFCKAAGRSFDEAELPGRNPDPDIERAAGASPAIGAVAVIGRADLAVILVPHGAAEAAAGQDSG